MSEPCIFCKIAGHELETPILYEDDLLVAFPDLNPQAPTHILLVPKRHLATVNELRDDHADLLSRLLLVAPKIAKDQGIAEKGYRLVINCNEGGGQSVFHLHLHILGGRKMSWPPG